MLLADNEEVPIEISELAEALYQMNQSVSIAEYTARFENGWITQKEWRYLARLVMSLVPQEFQSGEFAQFKPNPLNPNTLLIVLDMTEARRNPGTPFPLM